MQNRIVGSCRGMIMMLHCYLFLVDTIVNGIASQLEELLTFEDYKKLTH
jgi:hypothetical protein